MSDDAFKKINQLKKNINLWDYHYYVLNESLISDAKYDWWFNKLKTLEQTFPHYISTDSPTQRVAGIVQTTFHKIEHQYEILSLDNVFNKQDLLNFDVRIKKSLNVTEVAYLCEPKIDGLNIVLTYQHGELQSAVTRGDGLFGEDVTINVKTIKSIPLSIDVKTLLIVQGEIILTKSAFHQLNQSQINKQQPVFSNPRNVASGSIRQLDQQITAQRNLNCFFYNIFNPTTYQITTQHEMINFLKNQKFKTIEYGAPCANIDMVWTYIEKNRAWFKTLDYEIDGMVIKVNHCNDQLSLGATARYPKSAIAYKFTETQTQTKLLSIFATIGRTGKIVYNASLEAVVLQGTTIKYATLHNAQFIEKKDIREGDLVFIKKAADIIPEIVGVVDANINRSTIKWTPLTHCPFCQSSLFTKPNQVDQYCLNKTTCYKQQMRTIAHFCSREAMNIHQLGASTVEKLFNLGFIKDIGDIYELADKTNELLKVKGFNKKIIAVIIDAINKSKQQSFHRLLFGFGIPHLGLQKSKLLASYVKNLHNFMNMSRQPTTFQQMFGIGQAMIDEIINWLANANAQIMLNKLIKCDINLQYIEESNYKLDKINNNDYFYQKKFVITGTLSKPRQYFIDQLQARGAIRWSVVNKQIDFILVGEKPGNKLQQAETLGITILNETAYEKI